MKRGHKMVADLDDCVSVTWHQLGHDNNIFEEELIAFHFSLHWISPSPLPRPLVTFLSFTDISLFTWLGCFLASPQTLTSPVMKEVFTVLQAHSYEPAVCPCAWREWKVVNSAFSCLQKKKTEQPLLGNERESAEKRPDGSPLLVVCDSTEASELHLNGLCGLTRLLKTTYRSGVQPIGQCQTSLQPPDAELTSQRHVWTNLSIYLKKP